MERNRKDERTCRKPSDHVSDLIREIDSLVIAKMDASTNEHPSAKADEYLTILFYPAGNKNSNTFFIFCAEKTDASSNGTVVHNSKSVISSIEYHAKFTPSLSLDKFELPKAFYATTESVCDELIVSILLCLSDPTQLLLNGLLNRVVIGYDQGSMMVKIGREEPIVSMDNSGKITWSKHNELDSEC
ncbi:coatomer, beta' subunit [Artemisia annua]|uniref:Coatomer, beta' subunit n=1 Tax=Artemisia annua TaxID=35608 RepID=A0A2U1QB53_ARTAN|nr:coatomer, beta' subunit [Artemisia annua]